MTPHTEPPPPKTKPDAVQQAEGGCLQQACSPLSVDAILALRADYDRLRLMDSALALCGGHQGPAHAELRARIEAKQKEIGMGNWRFLELCKKCQGTGYIYAAYSLTEQSKCRCHDGYVLPANRLIDRLQDALAQHP